MSQVLLWRASQRVNSTEGKCCRIVINAKLGEHDQSERMIYYEDAHTLTLVCHKSKKKTKADASGLRPREL